MGQLARGKRKIAFSVDIRCIGTSGKAASSAHPGVDLWALGGVVSHSDMSTCSPCMYK